MKNTIYLRDWLYNAGIVGFLKILEFNDDGRKVIRGDNYISFDNEILRDFSDKYFPFVYQKANTINDKSEKLKNLSLSASATEKDIKEYIKSITASKTMKNDNSISSLIPKSQENVNWEDIAKQLLSVLPAHWEKNKDLYVKYYLQHFYKGKSIFNSNKKSASDIKEIFDRDFISPLFASSKHKITDYCKICNERIAKEKTFFDEGAFKVTGVSANESKNFYWNLIPNTHLCSLCELIYLCSFAGFSNLGAVGNYQGYLFVNLDTTVDELYKINNHVENFILPKRNNPYKEIIRTMLLDFQQRRSRWALGNILFVEFDTEPFDTKKPFKIQHFHIPTYIAKLFGGDNYKDFKPLEKLTYKKNNEDRENINVLKKIIDDLLRGVSLYVFLNEIMRNLLVGRHNYSGALLNIVKIQKNLDIYKIRRDEMIEKTAKKLWSLYYEGQNIAKEFRKQGAENKIEGISYKMLSALRVKDSKSFYDTMLRLYMNLDKKVPPIFLEIFSPESVLDTEALGYSFLTGLLANEYPEQHKGKKGGNDNE